MADLDHSHYDDDSEKEGNMIKADQKLDELNISRREDKWVWWLRVLTTILLLSVALAVCLVVYFTGRQNEKEAFEQDFSALAEKLVQSFEGTVRDRFQVLATFADGITSEANGSWPFVTPPNFSERAERAAKLAQVMVFHLMPLVTRDNLDAWNDYSVANKQWRTEGMARERGIPLDKVNATEFESFAYNPYVQPGENIPTEDINPDGPYYPIWLSYPVSDFAIANLDLFSDWEHIVPINKTYWTGKPTFEFSYDYKGHMERDIRWDFIAGNKFVDYQDDPHGTVVFPVFDTFGKDKKVAATLLVYIYWRTYFDGLLPPGADGVYVILENTCNQTYTYQVDGVQSHWIGRGDLHDKKYNYLETGTSINGILMGDDAESLLQSDFVDDIESDFQYYDCFYNIRVYPSEEFEDRYTSNKPMVQAIVLAALFLFTSAVFVLYDRAVEVRQKKLLRSALQSGKLVSTLFPKEVRERLYAEQEAEKKKTSKHPWDIAKAPTAVFDDTLLPLVEKKAAIATLYPNASVFFADIQGFTSWSSQRTPGQVFELLEGIFAAFDSIANRRGVFKVETIGDCYVACVGVPEARKDHATIMCRFAHDCLLAFRKTTANLAETLGADTVNLCMRIGIHSGSVTAGVLRGDKARFQLFGDTMNTASRMESNGVPSRIHVSQATADALIAAGKEKWLTPREDTIVAKGKGEMSTYFVDLESSTTRSAVEQTSSETDSAASPDAHRQIDIDA